VGALGHFIERAGVPTAQISLIREQTAAIQPPRALWVPFMLGRPFGAPNEPDFQRKVLRALLTLFEQSTGPVLADFPEEAPNAATNDEAFACPVSFARSEVDSGDPADTLRREVAQLRPWYDLSVKRRGRTTFGISGMGVDDAADYAVSYLGTAPKTTAAPGLPAGVALKRVCDDLKAYYYEAVAAQPGILSPGAIEHWFWYETVAARVFFGIQQACKDSADPSLRPQPFGPLSLVPRAIYHTMVNPDDAPVK
jgi:hypothetical protein